ncbi:MAG: MarR family winged helix-turn-helix transcriptional regulator [Lautropia sp.]
MASSHPEPSLGPLAGVLGFHLAQASVATDASFRRVIGEPFGLRKVEFTLLMLLLSNGPMAPKALARALTLTAPNLSLQLDRLVERELLRRAPNPADGRSQHIALTAAGQRLARKAAAAAPTIESALNARLSPAEHAMLIELLCKLCGRRAPA